MSDSNDVDDQHDETRPPLRGIDGGRHDSADGGAKTAESDAEREKRRKRLEKLNQEWGLDGLDEIDKRILDLLLNKPGMTDGAIGEIVGLSRGRVNKRKNRPAFQTVLAEAAAEPLDIFRRNQQRAARKLGRLIDAKDEQVSIRACLAHLAPLLRGENAGESGAEAFARFLEEAHTLRERRTTPTTSTGTDDRSRA